jgi:hypothetical protein
MQPGQNCGLLPQVAPRIAAGGLIVAAVGLLEIVSAAHQQQLEAVLTACPPVQLDGGPCAPSEIEKFMRLGGSRKRPQVNPSTRK